MLSLLVGLFIFQRFETSAAPVPALFPDITTHDIISVDSQITCPGRSVWDIVWSCLATTFAMTWVSVHPNVPWLEEKNWPLLKRRIFLMCLALLAPEVMIMWAFKQWRGAVMIMETVNKARTASCRPWTMAHAHFLQMGGFKLCTINSDKILLPRMGRYQTKQKGLRVWEGVLMYNSFRILLAEGKIDFPNISEDEINDRSKGDALSKGIALLQIIWFIAQLIARACQHLTITEVELTTAVLAGLNSIMYLFWWSKPLNVRCPFTIRTRELERKLVERGRGKCCNKKSEEYSEEQEEKWTFLNITEGFQLNAHMMTMARHAGSLMMKLAERVLLDLMVRLHWGTLSNMFCSTSTTFCVSTSERVDDPDPSNSSSAINQIIQWICATCKHVVIMLLHFPYMLMFLPIDRILRPFWTTSLESFKDAKDKTESKPSLELLFNEDDMRWIMSMIFYGEKAESKPLLYLSATAGAVFGSIHCAAWQSNFPSDVERLLWRTASLTIVGVCISVVVGIPIYGAIRRSRSRAFSARRMDEWKIWKASQRVMETAPAIVYPLSRFSLLILAVMSLRKLPVSALETVAWTKVVPHL